MTTIKAETPVLAHVMEDEMEGIPSRDTDRRRRLRRTSAMAVVLTSVALVAGACSGGNGPGRTVASVGPKSGSTSATQASSGKGDPLAYAKCMRANGLPDFPDPKPGGGIAFKVGGALDPASPAFKKAESHCKQFMGSGSPGRVNPDQLWSAADKLRYAQCMRASGVPKFPDPAADGSIPPIIKGGPLDPESPQFKKAADACKKYQPQNMPKTGPGGGS
ncbi:MAG: hypothetical protein JWN52_6462 [Actinomycetia bacterium]|nr:hypothetical protein [Actinomycetes bacterium]